jgi:hypothetical protein
MAKKGMRPEVKAQKMKNNKTANDKIICRVQDCEDEAVVFHGNYSNRRKVCHPHFINPPQTKTQILLASYGLI